MFVGSYYYGQGDKKFDTIQLIFLPCGPFVGIILGAIIDSVYTYQFNPLKIFATLEILTIIVSHL